jgi:glycine/sarcosine N-methyltransferase
MALEPINYHIMIADTADQSAEKSDDFPRKWNELADWSQRRQFEGDFFVQELKRKGAIRVLDVATGTGLHSVRLLEEGFAEKQLP